MVYSEILEKARTCIGDYCKACHECNGKACKNKIPGPGAKGIGDVAIRNYDKWKEIRINIDTLVENKAVDTSVQLFNQKFKYPIFAGPVGAVNLHYGDKYDDMAYNDILVSSCTKHGILAFTGDGTNPEVMKAATDAIKKENGLGIPTIKPWNYETILEKMKYVKESNAIAIAMDIVDTVGSDMKIFVDGGIRSGVDVFKALAMGADGVLMARTFVTALYGGEDEGIQTYIDKIGSELIETMAMCGAHSLDEINRDMISIPW